MKWVVLFLGGGVGAALRFALATWVDQRVEAAFPWGTLAVNVAGCFAIGLLVTLADQTHWIPPAARLFAVAGVLGGFTTFSTFGMETWTLVSEGRAVVAFANVAASVLAGVAAVIVGAVLARQLV